MIDIYVNTTYPQSLPLLPADIGTQANPLSLEAFGTLTADNLINEEGSDPAYGSSEVAYRAGCGIHLKPGFHVKSGSDFHAYIDPFECAFDGTYKSEDTLEKPELMILDKFQPHYESQEVIAPQFNYDDSDPEVTPIDESMQYMTEADIEQSIQDHVLLYPNPSSGELNIALDFDTGNEPYQIVIRDMSGREVFNESGMSLFENIDISHLSTGVYALSVVFGEDYFKITKKILKQ